VFLLVYVRKKKVMLEKVEKIEGNNVRGV